VIPRDSCGNIAIIKNGTLVVTIDGINGTRGYFNASLHYNQNGTVTVIYVPDSNGTFQIVAVKYPCKGIPVPPTPTIITVGEGHDTPTSCGLCTDVYGTGLTIAASNNFENQFFVQIRDCNRNPVAISGAELNFGLYYDGNPVDSSYYSISSVDLGNGVYPVEYFGNLHGPVDLMVQVLTATTTASNSYSIQFVDGTQCLNNCSSNGVCVSGQCICNPNYGGDDCSLGNS
jgi:hypothetical protein